MYLRICRVFTAGILVNEVASEKLVPETFAKRVGIRDDVREMTLVIDSAQLSSYFCQQQIVVKRTRRSCMSRYSLGGYGQ